MSRTAMRWSHTAVTASCAANGQTDRPKLKLVPFVGHCSARKKMPSNPDEWRRAGIAVGVILRQTRSKPPPPIRPAVTTASSFRRRSHDLQPERPAPRSSVGAAFSNWRFLHPKVWHNPTDGYRNLHLETPAAADAALSRRTVSSRCLQLEISTTNGGVRARCCRPESCLL